MGYLDTGAIILTVFSFAFFNLCSFISNSETTFTYKKLNPNCCRPIIKIGIIRILPRKEYTVSYVTVLLINHEKNNYYSTVHFVSRVSLYS